MLAFAHLVAGGEALMLVKRAGLDLGQAYEVIRASSGTSFVLETEGQLILNGSYDIGFTIDLALKDLGFARALGESLGVPLELEALVERTFERARDAYGGDAWSTMVVQAARGRRRHRSACARLSRITHCRVSSATAAGNGPLRY